jgi:chaperone BCS1
MISDIWELLVQEIQTNDFFTGTFVTASLIMVVAFLRPLPGKLFNFISKRVVVKLSVGSYDPVFKLFQQWIAEQNFDQYHKSYSLTSINFKVDNNDYSKTKAHFFYTPYQGTYIFRYKGKLMVLNAEKGDVEGDSGGGGHFFNESITLMYLGFSTKVFDGIIEELTQLFYKKVQDKVMVYNQYDYGWGVPNLVQMVQPESLILPRGMFEDITDDIKAFYDNETWYLSKGVPWHRGYLFEGKPGCGKTKSILALASVFNKDVYFFDRELMMSGADQSSDFKAAFTDVPEGQFVLFEDIDVFFRQRDTDKQMVSFSSFINCLDGFSAKHGVIVFMTSNYPELLDSAMTRAGRIDKTVTFDHCNKEQLEGIFNKFNDDPARAKEFVEIIPEYMASPAQIQEIMLLARGDAKRALQEARIFVKTHS